MDLRSALDARNRADRKDVRFQLLMAVPFTLFGVFLANILILPLIYVLGVFGISPGLTLCVALFNALLVTAIVIDVKRQPHETWFVPRYYQADGSVKSHEFADPGEDILAIALIQHHTGALGGTPLMTQVSDPHNLGQRGRAISSGIANVFLGGPRSIARALAQNRRIAARSRRQVVSSAETFVTWLYSADPVAEPDLKKHLESHPDQVKGFALAREIDVVARFRNPVEFHYRVR